MIGAGNPDEELLARAARRMAWQIAAVSAAVVVVVLIVILLLQPLLHHFHDGRRGPDDDGGVLVTAVILGGAVGILVAGVTAYQVARRAVAPLGDALALQRRFVADAGHELRTPLTVLHTRAQLIARRMDLDDPARPAVEQLLADSRVLGEVVEELLEAAQLTADPARAEPVDVDELLVDVKDSLNVLAEAHDITLLTGPPSGTTVNGSHTALRRALVALTDNALGHTPPGGRVTLAAVRSDECVSVTVNDSGDGPGPDPIQLTARFARGAGSEVGPGGRRFGIGLALVSEIVAAHDGTFTLATAPDGGAVAEIRLPAAPSPA